MPKSASDKPTTGPKVPPFEETVKRLTEIVQSLERGELPLEESLHLFEEGIALAHVAQARLDAAQKKVEQLLAVDSDGKSQTIPFEGRTER